MPALFNSRSRRQHEAQRHASPTERPRKVLGTPSPSSRSPASKFHTKRSRFKNVFSREATNARSQLVHVLHDIVLRKGEDWGQSAGTLKDVDLYRKAADLLTEYSQKTRMQEARLKQLQTDYEQKFKELKEAEEAQKDQERQLSEVRKMLLDEIDSLSCTLEKEKQKNGRLADEVEKLQEKARVMSLEQCETKHSLTSELQECHARTREENRIAAGLLMQLTEKDATIEKLKARLEYSSANADLIHRLQQESSFLYTVLCEAYEKIQDFLPSTEATIEEAAHKLKAATRTVDEALEAERKFQFDKNIDAEHALPFVRVKRDINTSP